MAFFGGPALRAALISEPYALSGGSAPYHDTYCQSFFAPAEVTGHLVEKIRLRFGERLTDCFEGTQAPREAPLAWLRGLWRLMVAPGRLRGHDQLIARVLSRSSQ